MKALKARKAWSRAVYDGCLIAVLGLTLLVGGCSNINDENTSKAASGNLGINDFVGTWECSAKALQLVFKEDGGIDGTYFKDVSQYYSYFIEGNVAIIYIKAGGGTSIHSLAKLRDDGTLTYEGEQYTKKS